MPTPDSRFDPNEREVAAQVIDGEAILINLSTGVYYSMDSASSTAWSLIAERHSVDEVAQALADRYAVSLDQAKDDVQRLTEELTSEQIVRESSAPAAGKAADAIDGLPAAGANLPYSGLTLNIYRDMGDLLALDPPMPGLEDIPWKPAGDTAR